MSLMMELVEQVRDNVVLWGDEVDADNEDYKTATTETDEDYRERMDSILDDVANEVVTDYYGADHNKASRAIAEWFSEDALMRTNHADLVYETLGINIINMQEEDVRDMLILKACVIDDYHTMYPF